MLLMVTENLRVDVGVVDKIILLIPTDREAPHSV